MSNPILVYAASALYRQFSHLFSILRGNFDAEKLFALVNTEFLFCFCSSVVAAYDDVTACLGQFGQSTRCSGILSQSGTRLSQIKRTHHHWIKGQAH